MTKRLLWPPLVLILVGLMVTGLGSTKTFDTKTFDLPMNLRVRDVSYQALWAAVAAHMGLDRHKPSYIVSMHLTVEPDGVLPQTLMQIRGTRLGDKHEALYQAEGGPVHWVWFEMTPDYKPVCGEAESQTLFAQLDQLHFPDSTMKLVGPAEFYLMGLQREQPTPWTLTNSTYYMGQHDNWRPATTSDAPDQHIPVFSVAAMHRQPGNPNTAFGGGVMFMLPAVAYQRHACISESRGLTWIP